MPSKAVSLLLVQLLYSAKNLTGSVNLLTQTPLSAGPPLAEKPG